MPDIDLSYKKRATKVEYDIESLNNLFTIVFMHDHAVTTVFFGDDVYDVVTDDELKSVMHDFIAAQDDLSIFEGVNDADDLDYHVVRVRPGDVDSIIEFSLLLMNVVSCSPLDTDEGYGMTFTEYCGWNSQRYDLPLIVLTNLLSSKIPDKLEPSHIRRVSDAIINYDGPPFRFPYYIENEIGSWSGITAQDYKSLMNYAIYSDGHIDWGSTAKLSDGDAQEHKFPPGLKKEMARFGLDIVVDDLVATGGDENVSKQDVLDLVWYNCNDVYGTRKVGFNGVIRSKLKAHDTLNELFPYTSAKSVPFEDLGRIKPLERDSTEAQLSGSVLIGPRRIKPVDNDSVQYLFPVPDHGNDAGEGATKLVDLLEYMNEKENMHPYIYEFFSHFRGKDTRTHKLFNEAARSQPITNKPTMNCPYYRNGKPTDAYIRVSSGGAHGSVMASLHTYDEDQIRQWIKADTGAVGSNKPTIDVEDVAHLDWSSFYPQLATRLELYKTADNVDRYTDIIKKRIALKQSLPFDRAEWTERDYKANVDQDSLKVLLNAVTGAGNSRRKYALLPLDNKTLSMRFMGNMHLWCLGQRLTEAGGLVISTNTDGLYLIGLDDETVQDVVDGYVYDYGMPVDPEKVGRFINRDTSNRIEMLHGEIQQVRGRLRWGEQPYYVDDSIGKNVPYPLASAHAVVRYITEDREWLTKPYDRDRLAGYVHELFNESTTPEAWYQVHVASGSTRLTIDGERQSKINRLVMTLPEKGSILGVERTAELKKDEIHQMWNMLYKGMSLNEIASEMDLIFTDETLSRDGSRCVIAFKEKDPSGGSSIAKPVIQQPSGRFEDDDAFNAYWSHSGAKTLAFEVHTEEGLIYEPVKVWRKGDLTGYTSKYGVALNSSSSLKEFDLHDLDVDAYVTWAENLLDGWKVTADIPEIGLVSRDDTVREDLRKGGSGGRRTKKDHAFDLIEWLYTTDRDDD